MKLRNATLIIFVAVLLAVTFWLFGMGGFKRMSADRIISRIEEYRQREGRLPDAADHAVMQSLGFELRVGWNPDYRPVDASDYRIIIVEGFDGPYWFYESKSRQWSRGFPR